MYLIAIYTIQTGQEATIRTEYGDTEQFSLGNGARQGYILSLFNIYAENIQKIG